MVSPSKNARPRVITERRSFLLGALSRNDAYYRVTNIIRPLGQKNVEL
jgi:hypothetical protein